MPLCKAPEAVHGGREQTLPTGMCFPMGVSVAPLAFPSFVPPEGLASAPAGHPGTSFPMGALRKPKTAQRCELLGCCWGTSAVARGVVSVGFVQRRGEERKGVNGTGMDWDRAEQTVPRGNSKLSQCYSILTTPLPPGIARCGCTGEPALTRNHDPALPTQPSRVLP